MKDLFKKGLALGLGLAAMSKEQIEKFIDEMVDKGELTKNESKDLIEDLIEKGERQQHSINSKLREQVQKILKDLDIPSKAELERLEKRIALLENKQANIEHQTPDND